MATIEVEVSNQDLWEAVFGSDLYGAGPWWRKLGYHDGADSDTIGLVEVWVDNPDDEEQVLKVKVKIDDLIKALQIVYQKGITHCGGIFVWDLENYDSCTADYLLQIAIFGEVIYG